MGDPLVTWLTDFSPWPIITKRARQCAYRRVSRYCL